MKAPMIASFAAILMFCSWPAIAQSTWNIDSAHSAAQFQVKHLMISNVRGEFGKMSGTISFDGKNISTIKAEAVIDVASINTREKKRDYHLRSADFFDATTYPTILSRSVGVRGNSFNLVGTHMGVTREISRSRSDTIIGMEANPGSVRMQQPVEPSGLWYKMESGVDAGGVVVSDEVQITLTELTGPSQNHRMIADRRPSVHRGNSAVRCPNQFLPVAAGLFGRTSLFRSHGLWNYRYCVVLIGATLKPCGNRLKHGPNLEPTPLSLLRLRRLGI
jgi:hypothetical protein